MGVLNNRRFFQNKKLLFLYCFSFDNFDGGQDRDGGVKSRDGRIPSPPLEKILPDILRFNYPDAVLYIQTQVIMQEDLSRCSSIRILQNKTEIILF